MRDSLLEELIQIRSHILETESCYSDKLENTHEQHRYSTANLLHYLALRHHDIRGLQDKLALLGLSSLGRAESHVLTSLDAVLQILHELTGRPWVLPKRPEGMVGFAQGQDLLKQHTELLFGASPLPRNVRIMVTMPAEAALDYELVRQLVSHGMDCMRINCAHDNADTWSRMIENLKRAKAETNKNCRVLMDLAGPKLRTGPIDPTPDIIKWHPHRDNSGRVLQPARIWLTCVENTQPAPPGSDACLQFPRAWLSSLEPGDTIRFFDARDASRYMTIVEAIEENLWAESVQTSYVTTDMAFQISRKHGSKPNEIARIGCAPLRVRPIILKTGDTLILKKALASGKPAIYSEDGKLIAPATIAVTLPEIFSDVRLGEPIWFDDGKIGGIINSVEADRLSVEITHARERGEKLLGDKGINLPESKLKLPALTQEDITNLPFITAHADLVGYSFVQQENDLIQLQSALHELKRDDIGIVLKIETRRAFENLPELLLIAMRSPCVGVMIARGDLAVECGYERLAEVQEEILWISEAAHVPVIWATQVLEKLAKDGVPSRAEITDAAMGERAECVMLNKGPHIVDAVRVLDDVLRRMEAHQKKKSPKLRQLHLADHFANPSHAPL